MLNKAETRGQRELINRQHLVDGFSSLGLCPGDLVFFHTSIRSFAAPLEGGPAGLIEALLTVVSPGGTIAAPTHSHPVAGVRFDPRSSPMYAEMGIVPRMLAGMAGAVRTSHPSHSNIILGADAGWLAAGHGLDGALGPSSPLDKIRRHPRGKVLLIGVDYTSLTLIHLAEWLARVPYFGRAWGDGFPPEVPVLFPDGSERTVPLPDIPGSSEGFNAAEEFLVRAGLVTEGRIGDARLHVLPAGPAVEVLRAELERRPGFLLLPEGAGDDYADRAHQILRG